jgi:hypothetical protein
LGRTGSGKQLVDRDYSHVIRRRNVNCSGDLIESAILEVAHIGNKTCGCQHDGECQANESGVDIVDRDDLTAADSHIGTHISTSYRRIRIMFFVICILQTCLSAINW